MKKLKAVYQKMKEIFFRRLLKLEWPELYYINGPETLPPPLSREEEDEVMERVRRGEKNAREPLITHNLRLVVYIAKKFDSNGASVEDLISIGTIGLIKAVNTFCPERNIKLATYASRCIENEISIDEPLNVDWDGNELLLSDILGSDNDIVNRDIEKEVECSLVLQAVSRLAPRERQIMELRFGLCGQKEHTQKQVADVLGISQSYISRLEKRIIERLKKDLERVG